MDITSLKSNLMDRTIQDVTRNSKDSWMYKIDGTNIAIKNGLLSKDYYLIRSTEDAVLIEKSPSYELIGGLIIDKNFKYADFNKWCIPAFKRIVEMCYQDFIKKP